MLKLVASGRLLFLALLLPKCSMTCKFPSVKNYQPKVSIVLTWSNQLFKNQATPAFPRKIFMQILKALHELHCICENKPRKKPAMHHPDFQVKFTHSPFDSSIPTFAD